MRTYLLLGMACLLSACVSTPLPKPDPNLAWVDLETQTGKLVMAERLDHQRMTDGRYFQVSPGSHELMVRFDYEVFIGGMSQFSNPQERLCYITLNYAGFQPGQRYRLQARSLGFNAYARLYSAEGKVLAQERQVNCLP
ncbi:lipoprotein [Pseudomonas fragi]|nr:lipoprotein [Pseudomonas fragi]